MPTTAERIQQLIDVRHEVAETGKTVKNNGREWTLSDLDQLTALIEDEESRLAREQSGSKVRGGRFVRADFRGGR